jgi:putative ATPase
MTDLFAAANLEKDAPHPLADRLRPQSLADVAGQDHLLDPKARCDGSLLQAR